MRDSLAALLEREFGPVIGEEDIAKLLGFPSPRAFRQSVQRGSLEGLTIFRMKGRPGWRILAAELAEWIDKQRANGVQPALNSRK